MGRNVGITTTSTGAVLLRIVDESLLCLLCVHLRYSANLTLDFFFG